MRSTMKITKKAERLLAATPGLHLHNNKLRVVFRLPGDKKPTKRSLGLEPTEANILFAANKLGAIKQDMAFGLYTNDPQAFWKKHFPDESGHAGLATLEQACEKAFKSLEHTWSSNSKQTIRNALTQINRHIGHRPVEELLPSELKKLQVTLLEQGLKPSTINLYFGHCQRLLDVYLEQIEEVTGTPHLNPFQKVPALKVSRHLDEDDPAAISPFTPQELYQILEHSRSPLRHRLIRWMVFTGMRPAEIAALAWEDVDLDRGTVNIRFSVSREGGHLKRPKTDHGYRALELTRQARMVLQEQLSLTLHLPAREELCIGHYGKKTTVSRRPVFMQNINTTPEPFTPNLNLHHPTWTRLLARAGVPYRRLYQLRHTFASWALMNGADPMWVAKQMGHSDWGMIRKIYGQWIPNAQVSPAEALGHKLGQFVPNSSPDNLDQKWKLLND